MSDPIAGFAPDQVIHLLARIDITSDTILVGGQAVAFWHWYYSLKFPDLLGEEGLLASKDVDYIGTIDVARTCASRFEGAKIFEAKLDDATPNCAVVIVYLGNRELNIDFLTGILGVLKPKAWALEIQLPDQIITVSLLHPVQCLITRIINILHPAISRRDEFAYQQLRVMFEIMMCHFEDCMADADNEDLKFCIREISAFLLRNEHGRRAHETLNLDLLALLKMLLPDTRIDERYRELTLRPLVSKIEGRRASRLRRIERTSTGRGFVRHGP